MVFFPGSKQCCFVLLRPSFFRKSSSAEHRTAPSVSERSDCGERVPNREKGREGKRRKEKYKKEKVLKKEKTKDREIETLR